MDEQLAEKARRKEAIAAEQAAAEAQRAALLKNKPKGNEARVAPAPTGRVTTAGPAKEERSAGPVRGPVSPMQAALSEALGSAAFAPFVPFDAASDKGESGNAAKDVPMKGPQRPPQSEDKDAAKACAKEVEKPSVDLEVDSDDESQQETQVVVDTEDAADAKVKNFLNRMRGTCPVGKSKKDKKKPKDDKPPKPIGAGPLESKEQIKQKKEKQKKEQKEAKKEKKAEKKREREEDRERALIAAARETKKIFGRKALVIGSSSEDSA